MRIHLRVVFAIGVVLIAIASILILIYSNNASQVNVPGKINAPSFLNESSSNPLLFTGEVPILEPLLANFSKMYPFVPVSYSQMGCGGQACLNPSLSNRIGIAGSPTQQEILELYHNFIQIPIFVSASEIVYNIPGLPKSIHLNLTGSILVQIYNGSITYWNDPQILAVNPAASSYLPHQSITPLRRADGASETLLFTEYLSNSSQWWNKNVGHGAVVAWPNLNGTISESGDVQMLAGCETVNYSMAYLSSSYLHEVQGNVSYAYLQDSNGGFENITTSTVSSFVYPLTGYYYAIVDKVQNSSTYDYNLRIFLTWILNTTQHENPTMNLNSFGYVALPAPISESSLNLIDEIN